MLFFVYHFFENHEHNPYLFKSVEEVNISKYYSHKLHHLRGHRRQKSKSNPEEYIFSIFSDLLSFNFAMDRKSSLEGSFEDSNSMI